MGRCDEVDQNQADLFEGAPPVKPKRTPTRERDGGKEKSAKQTAAKPSSPASGGLLNVRQAALRLGLSKSTLDKMRRKGKGPRFIKSTDRAVRYDPADLEAWIVERRRQSTLGE